MGLFLAIAVTFGGLVSSPAAIAADTFSINPATGGVVDASRSRIDFGTMAVAAVKSDNVIIKNSGDRTLSMVVFARFAYPSADGKSTLIDDSNSPAYDSAEWMLFGPAKVASYSLTLAVGATVVVPVSITIPKGALPGAHNAAIVVATTLGAGNVTVAKRVALMTKVTISGAFVAATSPSWVKDSTFYEINIRNFTAGRTFKTATSQVASLKTLGVGCVILDPIFPIGSAKLVGTIGSVFGVQDLSTVNTSLGTLADFTALVTALHNAGIKVVLTVPLDKAAIDNNWVVDRPNWFVRDAAYNLVSDPNFAFLGSYDYTNTQVPHAIFGALRPWVVSHDVDGFSFSGATSIPVNVVNGLAFRLQALKPLLIGTSDKLSAAYQPNALVFNNNDPLRTLLEATSGGSQTAASFTGITTDMNAYSGVNFPLNVVSNYSTMVGLQTETARMGAALPLAVALTFTMPGAPGIFQGQEVGSIKALKPYDADNIVWPAKAPAGLAIYQQLVKLKKANPALFTGSDGGALTPLKTTSTGLFAFKRTKGTNSVIVVVNLTKKSITAKFDAGAAANTFLFSSDKAAKLTATANAVTLAAFGYEIYTPAVIK
jgi:hypothetical protein